MLNNDAITILIFLVLLTIMLMIMMLMMGLIVVMVRCQLHSLQILANDNFTAESWRGYCRLFNKIIYSQKQATATCAASLKGQGHEI